MADPQVTLTIYNSDLEEATGIRLVDALEGLEIGNSADPLYVRNLLEGALGIAVGMVAEDIEITSGGAWTDQAAYAKAIQEGGERTARLARLLVASLSAKGGE